MIDRHYVATIDRYVEELARKSALMLHTGATPQLMREVSVLAQTVAKLAEASLDDIVLADDGTLWLNDPRFSVFSRPEAARAIGS